MLVDEKTILKMRSSVALYDGSGSPKNFYIFDTESGRQFSLNETGFFALSLVDGKRTFGGVVESCQNRYDIGREILERDLSGLVEIAIENGLLESS